ncbi:MAG: c-type cytochrome [Planctomycetaceae bacterium]|nr:c-type cytochrome [Planctomycetaceae bacterium]
MEVDTDGPKLPTTVVTTERRPETAKGETVTRERPEKAPAAADLAARVEEIFRARCLECHGGRKVKGKVKILDRDLLIAREKLVPGKPDDSALFQVITADDESVMPPKDQPRLRPGEIEAIRAWIAAGAAPFPTDSATLAGSGTEEAPGKVAGVEYVLKSILQDVRTLSPEDRPFARYFSLNHLLAAGASTDELDLHRDALAKAINHLSWERELVHPRPIEPTSTVFRIDLRALGWDERPFERVGDHAGATPLNLFDLALLEYPYGVVYEDSEAFDQLAREFLGPAGQVRPIAFVRADWFVSTATQPPLYDDFLRLPADLKALEDRLGVDAPADLDAGRAVRAGMTVSDVSRNNRVVERHPARYGAYWKSLDFRTSTAEENLFRDPLDLHPAGGEVIFNLPNGLQGYFLANAQGDRLEAAPTEIVTDRFAEDKVVRNGLSCIRCHDAGMKDVTDVVHAAVERLPGNPGFDKRRVLQLYPGQATLDPLLKGDRERFLAALRQALGKPPSGEPLIGVSQRFLDAPLSLATVAAELGEPPAAELRPVFASRPFARLGLAALGSDGSVRRDTWEDFYDRVVRDLGLGIPILPLDALTRRDVSPAAAELDVALATSKKNNVFAPGDEMFITVTNTSSKALHIELIGTSARGRKVILTPSGTVVEPGQSYRYPPEGKTLRIQERLGKEQVTVFASDAAFPAGELLRGKDVADRVVHRFDFERSRADKGFDPARLLKKTIEIETR